MTPAARLSAAAAPALVRAIEAHRASILAQAGGPVRRWALDLAIPPIERHAPELCEAAIDATLTALGGLTLAALAALLVEHMAVRGRTVDPTILQAHP